jgi:hypothetical protein
MKIFWDTKNMKTGSWRGNGLKYLVSNVCNGLMGNNNIVP